MNHRVWIALLLLTTGCQSYQTRTYDVTVNNNSPEPVTIWLTKAGEPYEPGWLAPEDLAIESPQGRENVIGGVVLAPGKTASTGQRTGKFARDTDAILRVYEGQLQFIDILAVNRDSPLRQDVALPPGKSTVEITRKAGEVVSIRVTPGK